MKKLHITCNLFEPILGTSPADEELYRKYIGALAPDPEAEDEEVDALGGGLDQKGLTVFARNEDGQPVLWDYQIKGYMKDACGMLSRIGGKDENGKKKKVNESSKLTAYKKAIDGLIFVEPRKIPIRFEGEIGLCQRPLRAMTMQGERVALAISEEIPAPATVEFDVICLQDELVPAVREWFQYGHYRGLGQWRNSGKGRFDCVIEEIE